MCRRIKIIVVLSLVSVTLLLFFTIIRIWPIAERSRTFAENFRQATDSPYLDPLPMETVVLQDLRRYFPADGSEYANGVCLLTLTADLDYYAVPGDGEPAYTLPAGTSVVLRRVGMWTTGLLGYGAFSLPTYETGWRYVRPFIAGEDPKQLKNMEELPWYYVKTADMDAVLLEAWYAANPAWLAERYNALCRSDTAEEWMKSMEYVEWEAVRTVDVSLYSNGAYLSGDLCVVMDGHSIGTLIAAGACIVTSAGLLLWEKKRQKVSA